ncbi:hypothetical protein DSL72_005076 [Monilinia vaccinii-corymbosi]|uniref:Uncharacterized protein n=1 Tax=Monilinia vaccinii-corymbosi TaxID=61207 RepID=A0A8A3PEE6_9HELO|nr:hypothetical protein DSL72_005076 [Monilinia vaccinii-corymbosi]
MAWLGCGTATEPETRFRVQDTDISTRHMGSASVTRGRIGYQTLTPGGTVQIGFYNKVGPAFDWQQSSFERKRLQVLC